MLIQEHVGHDYFGGSVNVKTYEPVVKSSKVLLFLPGTGECGPADGSGIKKLDKYGFPKLAVQGAELPFNIVAVQPPTASYSSLSKAILPWVQMEFNPSAIIVIGISLGAIAANELLSKDRFSLIKGVVSLSGKANVASIPNMRATTNYAIHGDKDTTVAYSQAKSFYEAYNSQKLSEGGSYKFVTISGLGHSGWDSMMDITPGKDDLYQWIIKTFGPEPHTNASYEQGWNDAVSTMKEVLPDFI